MLKTKRFAAASMRRRLASRRSAECALDHESALETLRELGGGANQQVGLDADGDEQRAGLQVTLGHLRIGVDDARGLARSEHGGDAGVDRGKHLRMAWLAEETHRRGQIGRAEENAVDAID